MLFRAIPLILGSVVALAQAPPTSGTGRQFTCPTSPSAIQAFSGTCPLSLTDGSASLNAKQVTIFYYDAPASFEVKDRHFNIRCGYGRTFSDFGTECVYLNSVGNIVLNNGPGTCPASGAPNGRQPRPSGGGNFKSRQSPSAAQSAQPSFVCPLQSTAGGLNLQSQAFVFQDASTGRPDNRLLCYYRDPADPGVVTYACGYGATTGIQVSVGGIDPRCPTTICPSAPYMQAMRRRSIDRRQVQAADIRAKSREPAVDIAGTAPSKVMKRRIPATVGGGRVV